MKMPVSTFLEMYEKSDQKAKPRSKSKKKKKPSLRKTKTPSRPTKFSFPVEAKPVKTTFQIMMKNAQSLSRERNFIRYDKEFVQLLKDAQSNGDLKVRRSESPVFIGRQSVTPNFIDSSTRKSSPAPKTGNTKDFMSMYLRTNQLLEIRQSHLKTTLKD